MVVDEKYPVPLDMYDEAKRWLQEVYAHGYFVMAFMIPYVWNGVSGIVLATSSSRSFRTCCRNPDSEGAIHDPEWQYYDVWWYEGLCMLNFAGLADSYYRPLKLPKRFQDFLQEACMRQEIANWRAQYCHISPGYYRQSLRDLFQALGIST